MQVAAFVLPLLGALWQMRGTPLWRSDQAVLAALHSPSQLVGTLSSIFSQFFLHIPLGDQGFRLALPSAIFTALAGLATLHLCHYLFRRQGGASRLDPWLSLGASLSVSFSLPWLLEAGVAGSASVGGSLSLFLVYFILQNGLPRSVLGSGLIGLLLGALFTESPWCAGVCAAVAFIYWPEAKVLLGSKNHLAKVLTLLGTAASTVLILWLPALANSSIQSIQAWSEGVQGKPTVWLMWAPLDWISSIGFLWCGGALFALFFSLESKRPLAVLALVILADIVAPGNCVEGWTTSQQTDANRLSLHLLALGVVAPLGALGLRTLGETAQALRLFAARPLAAMVAVLAIAGCLASAEDSLRTLEQTSTGGTQAWTDEALYSLPERALVLTQSPAWGRRLLAAQAQGERPDILVVPLSNLTRAGALSSWLEREPALEILLRDLSLADVPSERAIARLVDARPLFVELDPTWDRRLLEHVIPTAPLARLSAHALGRSERLAALNSIAPVRRRIITSIEEGLTNDNATRTILNEGMQKLALTLKAVRDRAASSRLLELAPTTLGGESPPEAKSLAPLAALKTL